MGLVHNHRDPINGVTLTLKGQPKKKTKRKKTTSYSISFRVQDTCEKEKKCARQHHCAKALDRKYTLERTISVVSNFKVRIFNTPPRMCACVGRARNSVPVPLLTQKYELIIIKWVFFFVSPIPFVQCILFEKSFRSWLYMLTPSYLKVEPARFD